MAMAAKMAIINTRSTYLSDRLDSMNIPQAHMPYVTIEGFDFNTDLLKRAPAEVQPGMLIYIAYNDEGPGVQQDGPSLAANTIHLFMIVKTIGLNFVMQYVHHSEMDAIAVAQQLVLGTEIAIPRNVLWQ